MGGFKHWLVVPGNAEGVPSLLDLRVRVLSHLKVSIDSHDGQENNIQLSFDESGQEDDFLVCVEAIVVKVVGRS